MEKYISFAIKRYFSNYSGVSISCWKRILLTFINDTSGGVSFFLCIYFVKVLHIDIALSGLIISAYGLGTALGGIAGGKLSDNISPTIISIISIFFKAAAFLILIKVKSVLFLIPTLFILGVTTYGFKTSNNVWILNQCQNNTAERLKVINILYTASNLGIGLSAVIVSIISYYGFQYIFLLSSILLFFSGIFLVKQKSVKIEAIISPSLALNNSSVQSKSNKKILFFMLLCVFLIGLIIAQLSATYSIYLQHVFPLMGNKSYAILFVLNSLIIVIFQTPLINRFSHANKILSAGIGAFLFGIGMMLLNFSFIFLMAIFSCIIYTIGEMLFISLSQLIIYQEGGAKKRGQSLGLFQMVFALSIIIGPALGGFIYHHFGSSVLWYLSGIIGIICLLICFFSRKHI